MSTYTSTLAFLVVARRFTAEDWEYNLRLLDTRACELGGQACKNLREKIETWKQLLFPARVTARKQGRGFSFSLAAITGIAEYLKSDAPDAWRGLTLHRMLTSLCDFYKAAIRRATRDLNDEQPASSSRQPRPSLFAAARASREAMSPQPQLVAHASHPTVPTYQGMPIPNPMSY